MSVSLTIFKNIYDNKTHKRMDFKSFSEFESLLYNMSKIEYKSKKSAPLISPATYLSDTNRKNINVVDWGGWACLDIDDWIPKGDLKDELFTAYSNYNFLCYSTASSTFLHPKFRLVFETNIRTKVSNIRPFWYALNTEVGSLGDKQVKDFSRMYYVPGTYNIDDNSNNFIFSYAGGSILDVDEIIEKYPLPPEKTGNTFFDNLPKEVQEQIVIHRKATLDNADIKWTSYRNCPFWPKKLAIEYMSLSSGWYFQIYKIMIAIAGGAVNKKYPITSIEIKNLILEFDMENGNWYKDRPIEVEANRAIEFVYRRM